MRLWIDADGCPVVRQAVAIAKAADVPVTLVCDTSHLFAIDGVEVLTVSTDADSADYAIANRVMCGDIVVTQDYGLSALVLARGGHPITQNGLVITDDNIGGLLEARGFAARVRRGGGRLKGPARRTSDQNAAFESGLRRLLQETVK